MQSWCAYKLTYADLKPVLRFVAGRRVSDFLNYVHSATKIYYESSTGYSNKKVQNTTDWLYYFDNL